MTLRIRFPRGRVVKRRQQQHRELLSAAASLLTPLSVMAYVLAFWRLAADIGLARENPQGVFSHWQLWIAVGVGLQFAARKVGRGEDSSSTVTH